MALLPDAPLLAALSCEEGTPIGGTAIWIQGSRFNARTRVYVGGSNAPRMTLVSDGLITIVTPPAQPGTSTVEVRATNDGLAWSNALHFTFTLNGLADANSMETTLMQRQMALVQQLVRARCGRSVTAEMVAELMAPTLTCAQRLLGGALSLIFASSEGASLKADLERQDAHGCTLLHYSCALRNAPALQLLLSSSVDANVADAHGHTPAQWASRFGFQEGEAIIARAPREPPASVPHVSGPPASTPPHQSVSSDCGVSVDGARINDVAGEAGWLVGAISAPPEPTVVPSVLPLASAAPPSAHPPSAHPPSGNTRSLEQFLEPSGAAAGSASTEASANERSLADFLTTSAAARGDSTKPKASI